MDPRVGFSLMCGTFRGPGEVLDLAVELDQRGHGHLFVTESGNDALTLLAAMAVRTARARIGSAIATVYLRHPWDMALEAINIDALSGGRFVLGLGTGHHPTVEVRLGLAFGKPVSRLRDYLRVVRDALDHPGDRVATRTEHFQNVGAGPIWRPVGRVPLVVAALGERMVRMAARDADGIMTSLASIDQVRRFRAIIDEEAAAAGRAPGAVQLYAVVHTVLRPDRATARDVMRNGLGYTRMPFYQQAFAREGLSAPDGVPDDRTVDACTIAGPPAYARERIAAWLEAGVDVLLLADTYNTPDATADYRALAELAEST